MAPVLGPQQGLGISFAQHQQRQQQYQQSAVSPSNHRAPTFQPTFSLRPTHSRGASSLSSPARSFKEPEHDREGEGEEDEQTPLVSHRPLPTTASSEAGSSRKGSLLIRNASRAGSAASSSSASTRRIVKRPSKLDLSNRDGRAPSPTPGQQGRFSRLSDYEARPQSAENSLYTEEIEATPRPDSSAGHSISPVDFPAPPNTRPPHLSQVSPDFPPPQPVDHRGHRVISQHIPRSASVPLGLPIDDPAPTWRDEQQQQKRTSANSALSSGTHSRNAGLVQAERGGMLSYSPGHGVYRHNEVVFSTPEPVRVPSRPQPIAPLQVQQPQIIHYPRPSGRQRSLSDGASLLLRQGTLLHPQSSNKRASTELGILLGSKSSRRLSTGKLLPAPEEVALRQVELMMRDDGHGGMVGKDQRIGLEAKKKAKARIEVDVVLERDCVVEGGDVRGRLEVLVRGGRRGEGVRVGAGKIRVLGFEDLAPPAQRHIFYHQSYPLPLFQNPPVFDGPTSSLFGSEADDEGYRLAVEGSHFIPFSMRLPLNGGAKGTYTSPGSKGPCVRYVVVGSVKLHMTATNKRSIAHFYRPIHLLPYLNPAIVLAPSPYPVVSTVERGLGWSLGGEKGKVELTARVARSTWVSGQRVWCEVGVRNGSSRKIKSLDVALLQIAQVFTPDAASDSGSGRCLPSGALRSSEGDHSTASTVRRKITEECLEADGTSKGAGRVTGKGWWTGVEAGGQGRWECSLQVPAGLVSIERARLIEVSYVLRVTINGSIYVDLPVTLINFLSIDPPPSFRAPGQAAASGSTTVQIPVELAMQKSHPQSVDISETFKRGFEVNVDYGAYQQQQPLGMAHARSTSDFDLQTSGGPARASSTTLDLDQLLAAGQARAEAARLSGHEISRSRPLSMSESVASNYGGAKSAEGPSTSSTNLHGMAPIKRARSTPQLRPKGSRMASYMSDAESLSGEDEEDLRALEARRRMGRQLSLAVLEKNEKSSPSTAHGAEEAEDGSEELTPKDGSFVPAFLPAGTPHGESIKMMQDTPFVPDVPQLSPTPIPDEICEVEEPTTDDERQEHESVLDDIMSDEYEHVEEVFGEANQTFGIAHDYQAEGLSEQRATVDAPPQGSFQSLIDSHQQDQGLLPVRSAAEHIDQSRSAFGSFANSAVSAQSGGEESEVGLVQQAVRRNVSLKGSDHLTTSPTSRRPSAAVSEAMSPTASPRKLSIVTGMSRQSSQDSPRKLSLASPIGMRRELSNGPSPLRDYSATTRQPPSPSPSRVSYKVGSPASRSRLAYSPGPSPMTGGREHMPDTETQWTAEAEQGAENEVPELAQSVAGDSASSEGDGLDSPHMDILTPLVSPKTGSVMSPGRRALPRVPSVRSNGSPQSSYGGSNRASWSPSAALKRSQSIFGNAAIVPLASQQPQGPRAQRPISNAFDDHGVPLSPALSATSSVHSVLPSVRSKIAHMESRDQALRQFSNMALVQSNGGPAQRRSYTAALGRLSRHSTYEDEDLPSGYSPRRQSTEPYHRQAPDFDDDDVPLAHLRKGSVASINSISTTATTIEDALSRNVSMASHKTYHTMSPRRVLPTVYMGGGSDEESSDGLL